MQVGTIRYLLILLGLQSLVALASLNPSTFTSGQKGVSRSSSSSQGSPGSVDIPGIATMENYSAVELTAVETVNMLKPTRGMKEKLVHFVRHAEGHHNVAGEVDFEAYKSEEFEDALLSNKGHQQCSNLAQIQQRFSEMEDRVELVVTSVLRRCLQTSSLSFPSLIGKVPWVATELCREQTGQHPCDRRVALSQTKGSFTHVDFSQIVSEEDPLYYQWNNGEREPTQACQERCEKFMDELFSREETEIVVCTHSAILSHLIPLLTGKGEFQGYRNAELRSYVITKKS